MRILKFFRPLYWKYPKLRPGIAGLCDILYPSKIQFQGWGLRTYRQVPWNDSYFSKIFNEAYDEIYNNFELNNTIGLTKDSLITFKWRLWMISFAIKHVIEFTDSKTFEFVECGVAEGTSSYISLREISSNKKIKNFKMHLYDAWSTMNKEKLLQNELKRGENYSTLDITRTKKHLKQFTDNTVYHQGHIPNSFYEAPESPKSINYLHIDLNSAKYTIDTLEFFYPRIQNRGLILFDDYGDMAFNDTKLVVDKFFSKKSGVLLKLATGQAIYFVNKIN